ncbi:MAG: hypothetical protein KDI83_05490 [Gammaproteobacteria bacterium]|nr:hypothetical protein [Gammaproteobacteria bacterium]
MNKLLLDWLDAVPPWFALLVVNCAILLFAWGKLNWLVLTQREQRPDSFAWAQWLAFAIDPPVNR